MGLRVYPLSVVHAPPAMEFVSLSELEFNTIHANDFSFFEELDAVIEREVAGAHRRREIRGLLFLPSGSARALPSRPTTGCARCSPKPWPSRMARRGRQVEAIR